MATSFGRRLQDWCLGGCGIGVVMAGVATMNEACRQFIVDAFHGELPAIVPALGLHGVAKQIAAYLPSGNPSLMIFGGAAFVLTVIMFKM